MNCVPASTPSAGAGESCNEKPGFDLVDPTDPELEAEDHLIGASDRDLVVGADPELVDRDRNLLIALRLDRLVVAPRRCGDRAVG
jgi:hypothetical protein